jgi:hypothetical protein
MEITRKQTGSLSVRNHQFVTDKLRISINLLDIFIKPNYFSSVFR